MNVPKTPRTSLPATYQLVEGTVQQCGLRPVCTPVDAKVPVTCTEQQVCEPLGVDVPKGEKRFAIDQFLEVKGQLYAIGTAEGGRSERTFAYYDVGADRWEKRKFHVLTVCKPMDGICYYDYRYPKELRTDGEYLFVPLDTEDGSSSKGELRARVRNGTPFFGDNAALYLDTNDTRSALHAIASTSNAPNMFFMVNMQGANIGAAQLDNRFEKQQAIEYLRRVQPADPSEHADYEAAIGVLEAFLRDDTVVFTPNASRGDNAYCDAEGCTPLLSAAYYSEVWFSYSNRFMNFIPDAVPVDPKDWAWISEPLRNPPPSAEVERYFLKEVVRRYELVIGAHTGRGHDLGGWVGNFAGNLLANWLPGAGPYLGQSHCVYEAFSMYDLARKLQTAGLLRHHYVEDVYAGAVAQRSWGMHTGLKLYERGTDTPIVLDSWPMGNGREPDIVPESEWGFFVANRWDVLPTWESVRLTTPQSKLITGATGLYVSHWYAEGQIARRYAVLAALDPTTAQAAAHTHVAETALRYRGMVSRLTSEHYPWHYRSELWAVEHGWRATSSIYPEFTDYKGRSVIHRRDVRFVPRALRGPRVPGTKYHLVHSPETPVKTPIRRAVSDYLKTPRGAVNLVTAAFFAFEILLSCFDRRRYVISEAVNGDENAESGWNVAQGVQIIGTVGGIAWWQYLKNAGKVAVNQATRMAEGGFVSYAVGELSGGLLDHGVNWAIGDLEAQVRDECQAEKIAGQRDGSLFGEGSEAPWYAVLGNTINTSFRAVTPDRFVNFVEKGIDDALGNPCRERKRAELIDIQYRQGPYAKAVDFAVAARDTIDRGIETTLKELLPREQEVTAADVLTAVFMDPAVSQAMQRWQAFAAAYLRDDDQYWIKAEDVASARGIHNMEAAAYWVHRYANTHLAQIRDQAVLDLDYATYAKAMQCQQELGALVGQFRYSRRGALPQVLVNHPD